MHKLKLAYGFNTPDPSDSPSFYEDSGYAESDFDYDKLKVRNGYKGIGKVIEYGDNELAWIGKPQQEDIAEYSIKEPDALNKTFAFVSLDPQWAFLLSDKDVSQLSDKEILSLFEQKLSDEDGNSLDLVEFVMENLYED